MSYKIDLKFKLEAQGICDTSSPPKYYNQSINQLINQSNRIFYIAYVQNNLNTSNYVSSPAL